MPFIETADRTSLFVTDWGSGSPVVFTHDWGLRSDQWNHSLGAKEAIRYLTRHGDARIARLVLIALSTPLLRRTAGNPGGPDPALIDANYAAVAADVPKWCADFEAAGPYFGTSPGGSHGLIDWTIRMIADTPLPVLLATLKVNADADMRAELQTIQVPALMVHGDHDALNADLLAFINGQHRLPGLPHHARS